MDVPGLSEGVSEMTTGSSKYFDKNPAEAGANWATYEIDIMATDPSYKRAMGIMDRDLDNIIEDIYGHPSNPLAQEFRKGAAAILGLRADELEKEDEDRFSYPIPPQTGPSVNDYFKQEAARLGNMVKFPAHKSYCAEIAGIGL